MFAGVLTMLPGFLFLSEAATQISYGKRRLLRLGKSLYGTCDGVHFLVNVQAMNKQI